MNCTNNENATCLCTENPATAKTATFRPAADVFESPEHFTIVTEMPGVKPGKADVSVAGGVLTVRGVLDEPSVRATLLRREFETGDYERQFRIGENVDAGAITAKLEAGVLTLTLPKAGAIRPRSIPVTGGQ
ncbi:MAG: Hsp20/alpha crystallin family protein [Phycisphaerales bacterium]